MRRIAWSNSKANAIIPIIRIEEAVGGRREKKVHTEVIKSSCMTVTVNIMVFIPVDPFCALRRRKSTAMLRIHTGRKRPKDAVSHMLPAREAASDDKSAIDGRKNERTDKDSGSCGVKLALCIKKPSQVDSIQM